MHNTVAVIVCHGMGQQMPFQTVDEVVSGLRNFVQQDNFGSGATGRRVEMNIDGVSYVRWRSADSGATSELPRLTVTFKDTGSGSGTTVHIYEAYWAPLTQGVATVLDSLWLLIGGGFRGLHAAIAGYYDRFVFGSHCRFWVSPVWLIWLPVALAVICCVIVLIGVAPFVIVHDVFGISGGQALLQVIRKLVMAFIGTITLAAAVLKLIEILAGFVDSSAAQKVIRYLLIYPTLSVAIMATLVTGTRIVWLLGGAAAAAVVPMGQLVTLLLYGCLTSVFVLTAAFIRNVIRQIARGRYSRHMSKNGGEKESSTTLANAEVPTEFEQRSPRKRPRRSTVIPFLLACTAFGVATGPAWLIRAAEPLAFSAAVLVDTPATWLVRHSVDPLGSGLYVLFIVAGAVLVSGLRYFLLEYVGDVAIYVSAHTVNRFWTAREQIQRAVFDVMQAVFSATTAGYERVIIVSHSLGSVAAYDALNRLIRYDLDERRCEMNVAARTQLFMTCGSPLDKTAFLFRSQIGDADEQRISQDKLNEARHPMIQTYESTHRPECWVNIWSQLDWISGDLEYYDIPNRNGTLGNSRRVHNIHDDWGILPLIKHTEYWSHNAALGILFAAIQGRDQLRDALVNY